jgi:histidinol-phosphate/aromatic aminotransferase/cobyric acid decarboxylase-like protein
MGSINKVIKKSPFAIKKLYYNIVPFQKRYGKIFEDQYNFLMNSIDWTEEKLLEYQNQEFLKLIKHCYENVPYYTKIFNERGLTPDSFKSIDDIVLLPYLTKDLIRENQNDLISTNMLHLKKYECRTSGSTGKKLLFYCDDSVYKKEAAFVLRSFHLHGATMYDKPSVWLRRYVPSNRNEDLWYYDYELKRFYMSAYHINDDTIFDYIKQINSKNYHTLVAYPSSVYILACLCEKYNLSLETIQKIHVSSEMMLPEWREKIIKVFGIVPVAHYGAIEKVCFMHQSEDSSEYYENPEYGITEYIDDGLGNHKIISTGFLNYYMPFLRYQTEDSVELNPFPSHFRKKVLTINGRTSDILVAEDGSNLPGVNFYSWIDKKIPGISMFQIIQKNKKDITFNFVASNCYSENTISDIRSGLRARLGYLNFSINRVREIQRNQTSGKIRCIVNEILKTSIDKEDIYEKLKDLKEQNGSHSPSINSIIEKIPQIQCNIDACFLSNPYATDLFLNRMKQDLLTGDNIKKYLELYPQQNKFVSNKISNYIGVPSENILVGNGAIELIEKFMAQMQGSVLMSLPTFSSYYEFNSPNCKIVYSDTELRSFEIIKSMVFKSKVNNLVLVNPNNPTGHYIERGEVLQMLDSLRHLDAIIIDESFIHFSSKDNPNDMSIATELYKYPNVILIKSMSKDFGIAGIRCGYVVMPSEKVKNCIQKGFLWNSNGIAEYFFGLLEDELYIRQYEECRVKYLNEFYLFYDKLKQITEIEVYPSKTNFFLINLKSKKSFDFFCWMLIEKGIYVRSMDDKFGKGIDNNTFVRIAGKTIEENDYIVQSIKEFYRN